MKKFNLVITKEARLNSSFNLPRLITTLQNINGLNIITNTKKLPKNAKGILVEYAGEFSGLRRELGLSVDQVIIEPIAERKKNT